MSSQWLFDDSELFQTPTIEQGFTVEKEIDLRMRACRIIERVGKKLGMSSELTQANRSNKYGEDIDTTILYATIISKGGIS
jgi:hypothetical protein